MVCPRSPWIGFPPIGQLRGGARRCHRHRLPADCQLIASWLPSTAPQAPAGVPAAIAGLAVMSFLAPVFLGKLGPTDAEAGGGGGASAAAPTLRASGTGALRGTFTAVDEHVQRGYDLEFLVQPNCALLNESLHTLQQTVLTGETNPYKDIATAAEAATPVPPPDGKWPDRGLRFAPSPASSIHSFHCLVLHRRARPTDGRVAGAQGRHQARRLDARLVGPAAARG